MPALTRHALLPVLALAVLACSSSGSSPSSGASASLSPSAPAASPSPSTTPVGAIDHKTGATDVLLRYDVGGGLMMAGFSASQTPILTLYGDGTVVFRNQLMPPMPAIGSVTPMSPLRTARLSEEQIQALLEEALGQAGLGIARENYENPMIADAGTTTFTVDAGGVDKTVAIVALGNETPGVPDAIARTNFQRLAEHLADFDKGGTVTTDVYAPAGYRAILMDGTGQVGAVAWPWTTLKPADFSFPADPNAFQLGTKTITQADVDALGLGAVPGGFQGMVVSGPSDGKTYALALRPLLPDETE
jgi:hypothetical protein